MAVVSTTLAVCGVFVPIRFMQSTVGRYFYEFGVTVTVAVCVSALVALTLTPMLASRVLRQTPKEGPVFRFLERGLRRARAQLREAAARSAAPPHRHRPARRRDGVRRLLRRLDAAAQLLHPGRHERGAGEREAPDRHAARRDGPRAARDGGHRLEAPLRARRVRDGGRPAPAPAPHGEAGRAAPPQGGARRPDRHHVRGAARGHRRRRARSSNP